MRRFLAGAATRLYEVEHEPRVTYACNRHRLRRFASHFVQLREDEVTLQFLRSAYQRHWLEELVAEMIAALLQVCMTAADANVLCGLGQMFVISTAQARTLLDASGSWSCNNLLDCGAGDGGVTRQLQPLVEHVVCTEVSASAATRLRQYGWECYVEEIPLDRGVRYDVVCCLNVICRAARPLSLLRALKGLMHMDSVLLLAIVLPFRPAVLGRARTSTAPLEQLPQQLITAASFEEGICAFIELVLQPLNFAVCAVSRVPYYSLGTHGEYYVLDDAILVCRQMGSHGPN